MSRCSPFINQQFILAPAQAIVAIPFLDNVTREPHWLREIRIAAFQTSEDVEITTKERRALGMAVEVGLRIQDAYLAHPDVVPAQTVLSPLFDLGIADGENLYASGLPESFYGGVWTLPEPLFVPAGAKLYCCVRFNPEATPNLGAGAGYPGGEFKEMGFFVTFVGQRAYDEEAPAMSRVPFAATWRTPIANVGPAGVLQEFRSPDAELYNFTKDKVVVQRIVARNYYDDMLPARVRYSDVQGRYVNKDSTPMLELHSNGAWNLGVTMESKEFFSVEGTIDSRTAVALPNSPFSSGGQQGAIFGLVGYRDIPTHVLWGPSLVAPPSSPVAPGGATARLGPKTPFLPQARAPRKVVP